MKKALIIAGIISAGACGAYMLYKNKKIPFK